MNTTLDNTPVNAVLSETDAQGQAVPNQFDTPPTWGVVPATLATLTPSVDGSQCLITPTGVGVAQVTASAVVGGVAFSALGTLTINAGAVANLAMSFQPVAPAPSN